MIGATKRLAAADTIHKLRGMALAEGSAAQQWEWWSGYSSAQYRAACNYIEVAYLVETGQCDMSRLVSASAAIRALMS